MKGPGAVFAFCISVAPCGGSAWPRKNKKIPGTGVWNLRKRSSREEPALHMPALSDKSRRISRDTSVPFIISFVCRMCLPQPRGAWALLGRHGEKQCPEMGIRCPEMGTSGLEALPHRMGTCRSSMGSWDGCSWAEEVREAMT